MAGNIQTRTKKPRLSIWFTGFAFDWALLFSLIVGSTKIFPALHENPALTYNARICFYGAMFLSFLVILLVAKRIGTLHAHKGLLVALSCIAGLGIILFYLAAFQSIPEIYLLLGIFLAGGARSMLSLAWGEIYGTVGTSITGISVSLAMIGAAGLYAATLLLGESYPAIILTLLALFPFLSLVWLLNAGALVTKLTKKLPIQTTDSSESISHTDKPESLCTAENSDVGLSEAKGLRDAKGLRGFGGAQSHARFRMPLPILVGIFIYAFAFGCVLGWSQLLPSDTPYYSAALVQSLGIGIAALLMIVGLSYSMKKLDLGFTYRTVLPFVSLGFFLLPIFGESWFFLISTFAISGYVYFLMFTIILYADISFRLPAPPIIVNAQGAGASALGTLAGVVCSLFFGNELFPLNQIPTISLVTAFVLILASTFLLNERNVSSLWGLVKPAKNPAKLLGLDERCAQVAQHYGLTPRETEVLLLLAKGRDTTYIQKDLTLSVFAVRTHIRNIYEKLEVHSRQDLLTILEQSK
jgi:DNA-binding CsgD family transcriptional regulator